MAFSIGAFYIFLGGAPLVAAAPIEMSPVALGAAMGSTTAGFVLGSCLSRRFAARHALTTIMIPARLVASALLVAGLDRQPVRVAWEAEFFAPRLLVGLVIGPTFPRVRRGVEGK